MINWLDWTVIVVYLVLIVGMAIKMTRTQTDLEDYYLAGKKIKWWQSGVSTMATQLSAVSFISAPAFVALKQGGGLKWLCYEFGVPLALILVMTLIIPTFHRRNYISIYEYLEERFDTHTRSLISLLFQLGRGLATAVAVLAGGLILSTALAISTTTAIILIGAVTVLYDALGGIRVVILSDFMQMTIIAIGIVICGGVALSITGWQSALAALDPARFHILDFKHLGASADGAYAFWPMLIGGFFLYASYYGCDQSQVQRELTVGNIDDVKKSLLVNAFGRFPLVALYCFMGIFVGAVFASADSLQHVATQVNMDASAIVDLLEKDPDRMVPLFIISYLPHGVIGFIFVAIMAALMSSLDSGLNALSAVTVRDFYQKYLKKNGTPRHYLVVSKLVTLCWGVFCLMVALVLAGSGEATRHTTIVLINAIGSLLYGPILATFLLGMLTKGITARGVQFGIIAGILFNLLLKTFTEISWLWWNATGFLMTVLIAVLYSRIVQGQRLWAASTEPAQPPSLMNWRRIYWLVVVYFFLIILITYLIERLA
ncbi:MAG: sodium/solute symporter [bacterium]